jgi:hypothetical protein
VTHPHDDGTAMEHDPTGMRDLLSRLPAPGPMPEELVARITAALAAEAAAGRPTQDSGAAERQAGGEVVSLPRRSSRLRHLGVAAAVVTALGLGGYGLAVVQGGGGASVDTVAGGSAESAADAGTESGGKGADESATGEADTAPALRAAPTPGSGEVVVVMSGADHTSDGLAVSASTLAAGPLAPLRDLAAEAPAIGPIGTPTGARSCADALGIPRSAGLVVDVAQVDGRPGAVLVSFEPGGRTAYAVERSCTTGTSSLISGPVSLD